MQFPLGYFIYEIVLHLNIFSIHPCKWNSKPKDENYSKIDTQSARGLRRHTKSID